ncbi:MAG: peptidylprolyl isomerase [Bacteroidales bacterium]|nr:peptidylprolyl isomerase [Bacteroidales bacterium]
MKKTALLLLLAALSLQVVAQNKGAVIDQVVAVVGKNIIKLSDIESNYAQLRMQKGYENPFENRCNILESMLMTKLMLHKGAIDSVEVTEQMIAAELDWSMKSLLRYYGTKENLQKQTGSSYDAIRENYAQIITERYIAQQVEEGITANVKVTPREVQEYFNAIPSDSLPTIPEEYEMSVIEMTPTVGDAEKERVRLELNRLRERVLKGENFSMLATMYSEDPGSAQKGGELGFFGRGDMVGEFEAAAFVLKPGEVSPVIETKFGYHIIQLIERRGNTINARHILMIPKVSSNDLAATQQRMDSVLSLIKNGSITFDEAARRYSSSATKSVGGVVSNAAMGNRFNAELAKQQFPDIDITKMNEGDISPIKMSRNESNQNVFRVVKLTKKVPTHKANLTDDYDKLYNAALQTAKNEKVLDWAAKMIKNTYIRINDDFKTCTFKLNWTGK